MIVIKNKHSLRKMEEAGRHLAEILNGLKAIIAPGITTLDIDSWIADQLKKRNMISQTKGYMGYRHVCCVSINEEVVHGVPTSTKKLKDGDLVKVDVCASWKGYCADMARAFLIGAVSSEAKNLVAVAQLALDKGIEQARSGNRVSDISAAVQQEVEAHGFGVVRDFAGHGIGRSMHEDPEVLNYGKPGEGPVLRPGMALAIEPMITVGKYDVFMDEDGWTVKTSDNSLATHVEDTVIITEGAPIIATRKLVD